MEESKTSGDKSVPPAANAPQTPPAGKVMVDEATLTKILEGQSRIELELEEAKAKAAGLEAMIDAGKTDSETGKQGLRLKKNYEPSFRTARLSKFRMNGDSENLGWVVGWTSRGAYLRVVDTGVQKEKVDFIDLIFLDNEKTADGQLRAEAVPLLAFLNEREQVHCKIVDMKKREHLEPTGEEIRVVNFDPAHGLMETGETIDGYVGFTDVTLTVQVPGRLDPVVIDEKYVN